VPTMRAYEEHYATEFFEVVDVEQLAETRIKGKYLLTGRWDLVVRDRQGRVWIWDHKSTARFGSGLIDKYSLSLQFQVYAHMGREKYGDQFGGMRINFIQYGENESQMKFVRSATTPMPHRQRTLPDTVEFWEMVIASLRDGRDVDQWPRANNRGACYAFGQPCPFMERCNWGA